MKTYKKYPNGMKNCKHKKYVQVHARVSQSGLGWRTLPTSAKRFEEDNNCVGGEALGALIEDC